MTHAPGLVGALLVGVAYAKALGATLQVPVIGAHHMEGHLFATSLDHAGAVPPFTALLVSGGHTMLLDVAAWGDYQLLGATRDDAAGEAFDKVAAWPSLPRRPAHRSAGPRGRLDALPLCAPHAARGQKPGDDDYYDLSFSGLKTAVLRAVRAAESRGTLADELPHLGPRLPGCAGGHAGREDGRAARAFGRTSVVLGGGVACNRALQEGVQRAVSPFGGTVFSPSPKLATDNAAMIARAGLWRLEQGERSGPELNARDASGRRAKPWPRPWRHWARRAGHRDFAPTISRGMRELDTGGAILPAERKRRPGGGRKRTVNTDDRLAADLDALVEPTTSSDPDLAAALDLEAACAVWPPNCRPWGHTVVSYRLVAQFCMPPTTNRRANRKTRRTVASGSRCAVPVFNEQVRRFQRQHRPAISVDTKGYY